MLSSCYLFCSVKDPKYKYVHIVPFAKSSHVPPHLQDESQSSSYGFQGGPCSDPIKFSRHSFYPTVFPIFLSIHNTYLLIIFTDVSSVHIILSIENLVLSPTLPITPSNSLQKLYLLQEAFSDFLGWKRSTSTHSHKHYCLLLHTMFVRFIHAVVFVLFSFSFLNSVIRIYHSLFYCCWIISPDFC